MTPVIQATGLTKIYSGQAALDGLDWRAEPGESWALLGANGAGKSTLLKLLMGFIVPSTGSVELFGEDPIDLAPATRARVGYVAELPVLPGWTTVEELVRFHSALYPRWDVQRAEELARLFELPTSQRIATLSKGQNRRLMLLLTLSQGSELALLDEPGSGLDVGSRRALLQQLGAFLAEEGRTMVLSSHIVTDVERIVTHVAILAGGRLVEAAPLDDLKEQVRRVRVPRALWERSADAWHSAGLLELSLQAATAVATVRNFDAMPPALRTDPSIEAKPLGLEDIFLAIQQAHGPDAPLEPGASTDDLVAASPTEVSS